MQQHAATFFARAEDAAHANLPQFVKDEFDAILECGILAHGFLRLHCADCGHEKLVAFSCKRRGFCLSCGARRMAQTAAHLVDHVIPHVPVRQWVLSLPIPLRLLLAAQPKLVTPVLQVVHRVITRHLLGLAGLKPDEADSGAVTLIQRFGSAANLNIHLHCLVLDGVYRRGADGVPEFVEVPAPTDEALQSVLHKIITRTMKLLTACKPRHRHQEFLSFLCEIDKAVPAELDVHCICDNYATHSHPKVKAWLATKPRWHMHFISTYSSWLNQVELFFALIRG